MDLRSPTNQITNQSLKPSLPPQTFIRTMRKDIERLSKKAAPPKELPVSQPARPSLPPSPPLIIAREKPKEKVKAIEKEVKKRRGLKIILIGLGLLILILGGAGGFLYWWNYLRVIPPPAQHYQCRDYQCVIVQEEGTDQCLTDADCLPPEPTIPLSLIPVEETETIEISVGQEDLLLEKIKTKAAQEQAIGTLKRILVKLTNGEKRYASLTELIKMIGASIPLKIVTNFQEPYTLFIYQPEKNEFVLCQQANILDARCFGPRLGLVVQITDQIRMKELIKEWEETMVADLQPLILAEITAEERPDFQDDLNPDYQVLNIRYKNLPISPIAINYSFWSDYLIIGTSKYCLYQALDDLGGQSPWYISQ